MILISMQLIRSWQPMMLDAEARALRLELDRKLEETGVYVSVAPGFADAVRDAQRLHACADQRRARGYGDRLLLVAGTGGNGDAGAAAKAAQGFRQSEGVEVVLYFPTSPVSPSAIQELRAQARRSAWSGDVVDAILPDDPPAERIVNFTGHPLVVAVHRRDGSVVEVPFPILGRATVRETRSRDEEVLGIPTCRLIRHAGGIPAQVVPGLYLVVTAEVAEAAASAGRSTTDLLVPDGTVFVEEVAVTRRLVRWPPNAARSTSAADIG